MSIYTASLTLPGARAEGVNPQPQLGAADHQVACKNDGSLLPEELLRFGGHSGARMLPYRRQDRYRRSEAPVTLKTVVLENEHLTAIFLPELGGRLWSLYAKDEGRELLLCNPALRTANLAIRGAWFAGGIEWNLGHYGHTVLTCESLYCTTVTAQDGEQFLRFYEYEAMKAQVLQMDFHLPAGARQLAVHVRIENARETESSLYWWTNTAVPLDASTRVFSGTPEVVFQRAESLTTKLPTFGHGQMPHLPDMADVDASFPHRIPCSTEYFFQNPQTDVSPWETASGADGAGFFERSTQPLRTRKMFCWGHSDGGQHWQDYLALPGRGNYVEVQAGLAPTQLHTSVLPAGGCVCFTQLFGAFSAPPQAQTAPWGEAQAAVAARVEQLLPAHRVQTLNERYAEEALLPGGALLHRGGSYGGLEVARRRVAGERPMASQLEFPAPGDDSPYAVWLMALAGCPLTESGRPYPYITDPVWQSYLEASLHRQGSKSSATLFHLGVLLAENGNTPHAKEALEAACKGSMKPWALHALGQLAQREGDAPAAAGYLADALTAERGTLDISFREDAMAALLTLGQYEAAWTLFQTLPTEKRTERLRLLAAEAAVKTGHDDYLEEAFAYDYATIREGSVGLSEIWLEYMARKDAREKGVEFTADNIDRTRPLPYALNFRMKE